MTHLKQNDPQTVHVHLLYLQMGERGGGRENKRERGGEGIRDKERGRG